MRSLYSPILLAYRFNAASSGSSAALQFRAQSLGFLRIHVPHVAAAQSLAVALRQSASRVDQPRARSHQSGPCPNHRQIRLRLRAAMLHRIQQLRIDPRQPRQRLRIQPIVFLAALPDQPYLARVRHDHFVPQSAQQPADPWRMRPGFQRDPAARHCPENFLQRFRIRADPLFRLYLASFIQHAVPAVAISQIQSDGQSSVEKYCCSASPLQC